MPRQPPSLRNISIDNIVCHFEDVWCRGSTRELLECSSKSDVFTPFQYLCDEMVQEIIDRLGHRKLLRSHHYKILLHSNIRRLDLGVFRSARIKQNDVIKTLGIRCQKLTHFDLGALNYVKPELMCTLMRNLPQIVCLKKIRPDATVMKTISENCPNLQELDLTCCNSEDTNLLYLCNSPGNLTARLKLKKLSIIGVYNLPSIETVAHLLKNQASLQFFLIRVPFIDQAFDQMYGEEFRPLQEVPSERIHNLLDVTIDGCSEGKCNLGATDRLHLTLQCYPWLTKLTLTNLMEGVSLNNVAKLKHLKTLSVSMFRKGNFSRYMAPLLSKIGDNLTYLKCEGFDEVSLILIGKSCLNLESLRLRDVSLVSEQHSIDGEDTDLTPYFPNLNALSVTRYHSRHSFHLLPKLENFSGRFAVYPRC